MIDDWEISNEIGFPSHFKYTRYYNLKSKRHFNVVGFFNPEGESAREILRAFEDGYAQGRKSAFHDMTNFINKEGQK